MTTSAPPVDDVDLDLLEPVLRSMVEKIGLAATLKVVERHAGLPLYVPRDPGPEHPLSQLVGHDAARAFCTMFPGENITLPKAGAALRDLRNRRMRAARDGSTIRQLAQGTGLGRRRVQQILAEGCGQPAATQPGLFE